MNEAGPIPEITPDDKLWAALGYPIPIVPIIMLLMEDKKNRPFIRYHAVQSLALNVTLFVLSVIMGITAILACLIPLLWFITFWPAYEAYQGKYMELPVITNFIKSQGWV